MLDRKGTTGNASLLEVRGLRKYFPVKKGVFAKTNGWIKAVDDISFTINKGETFGLVGESGCGKSTTTKLLLLIESLTSGSIWFKGKDIAQFSNSEQQAYREAIQAVFQDPTGALDPRQRVSGIISEPITARRSQTSKAETNARIAEVLQAVGMRVEHARLFPHEFSGGQRQRIAIARALSTNPELIILDEPISSLDVSIRAQVMNLLLHIQEELGLTYMVIAHDLAVILHMSSRVGVMYVGKIVEAADGTELYQHPAHPYTKALFGAAFHHLDANPETLMLSGEVASPLNPPPGCHFHPRCPHAKSICSEVEPELKEITSGHKVACFLL